MFDEGKMAGLLAAQLEPLLAFMRLGEPVIWLIFLLNIILWSLVVERYWYFNISHRRVVAEIRQGWLARADHSSWFAHRIREMLIAQTTAKLAQNLLTIHTLVALLPLLGLLGTVQGMVEAFDVLSLYGTGHARALSDSLSNALITTMSGLIAAIPGLFIATLLAQRSQREIALLADQLEIFTL